MKPMKKQLYLAFEFVLLFGGVPSAVVLLAPGAFILPVLWAFALGCAAALFRDSSFDRRRLWRFSVDRSVLKGMLVRGLLSFLCLCLCVLVFIPAAFFRLPRSRPLLWLLILLLYPLFSVLPQGVVYRAFLFHRYRELLPEKLLLVAGAFAFSVGHLSFGNPWALGLTLVGGLFFSTTYLRTRSMPLSSLEHSLYGWMIFTVGFGEHFVQGTRRLAEVFGG